VLRLVGIVCATGSILFDLASYYRQIKKTLKTKHSGQVSSTAYILKLSHYLCSIVALVLFYNWVGFFMEMAALIACLFCFVIVVRCKPKNWKLIDFGK
jgi:putative methionine-R-sulfoxide reductase with GAF domain